MLSLGLVIFAALTAAADPQQCREALAGYNEMVVAVHAAAREYERCVKASLGRDDCGMEFIELQVTQRDYERAVDQRRAQCSEASDAD